MAFKKFGAPIEAHLSFVQPEPASTSTPDAEARADALRQAALANAARATSDSSKPAAQAARKTTSKGG